LGAVFLTIENAGQQHSSGSYDGPARLDHDGQARLAQPAVETLDEGSDGGSFFAAVVGDAETAAQIEVADGINLSAQAGSQRQHLVYGFEDGSGVQDLRPDMAAHALGG